MTLPCAGRSSSDSLSSDVAARHSLKVHWCHPFLCSVRVTSEDPSWISAPLLSSRPLSGAVIAPTPQTCEGETRQFTGNPHKRSTVLLPCNNLSDHYSLKPAISVPLVTHDDVPANGEKRIGLRTPLVSSLSSEKRSERVSHRPAVHLL